MNNFQAHRLFAPIQKLSINDNDEIQKIEISRWLDLGRSVTYDYFIRSCELEDNIYLDYWHDFSKATQHCLITAEQVRHNGIMLRDEQKFLCLRESFENYLSAVMNELGELYIKPFISVFHEYEAMNEAWQEVQENFVNPKIQNIVNELILSEKNYISSIRNFVTYMKNAKSLLFSLKSRFSKKIGREEYLLLENFLSKQENLVDSFLCKNLDQKLYDYWMLRDWFQQVEAELLELDKDCLKNYNLKITHLLSLMSSYSYSDNIFS